MLYVVITLLFFAAWQSIHFFTNFHPSTFCAVTELPPGQPDQTDVDQIVAPLCIQTFLSEITY